MKNIQVRPTNMAAAFVNAAMSNKSSSLRQVVIDRALSDDEKAPLKSGYNRVEKNNVRVSNMVLRKCGMQ